VALMVVQADLKARVAVVVVVVVQADTQATVVLVVLEIQRAIHWQQPTAVEQVVVVVV
jgi:hypothetical protein